MCKSSSDFHIFYDILYKKIVFVIEFHTRQPCITLSNSDYKVLTYMYKQCNVQEYSNIKRFEINLCIFSNYQASGTCTIHVTMFLYSMFQRLHSMLTAMLFAIPQKLLGHPKTICNNTRDIRGQIIFQILRKYSVIITSRRLARSG